MKTVLVTGFSSRPGYGIALKLREMGYKVVGVYNKHPVRLEGVKAIRADITKDAEKLIGEYDPDIVVHAAAIGLVDYCEEHKQVCYKVNVDATRRLLMSAAKEGMKIIYISTDYVFDGRKGLYSESDVPVPINYYGLTKLVGEEITRSLEGTVIRVSAVFGPGPGRPNFAQVLYEKLSNGEKVKAAIDQYLSPTYNMHIGMAVAKLLELSKYVGILHVTGPRLSRYEYALLVAEILGADQELIRPITMEKIPYKAPRPRDSSLNNEKAMQLLGIPLDDIKTALKEYLSTFKTGG